MKFVIDRKIWLRGDERSLLLRGTDLKRCCVGIYLKAVGVSDGDLLNSGTATSLAHSIPEEAKWLLEEPRVPGWPIDSKLASGLYNANDNTPVGWADSDRESLIIKLFAQVGVEVTFEG